MATSIMPRTPFEEAGEIRRRPDGVTIPAIWIAFVLSILIHGAALWQWKLDPRTPSSDLPERDKTGPLIVELMPRPSAPSAPQSRPQAPQRETPPPRAQKQLPRPQPPAIALKKPAPRAPTVPAPTTAPREAPPGDLASYVESRRQARGESPAAAAAPEIPPSASTGAEDERARANRLAAANLGLDKAPGMGSSPRKGGGVFDIRHLGYDYAEFVFYGWNKDARRNTAQLVEVRKGGNPDIRTAVVRRMIAIIRDHEQGDFIWESHRLGRSVKLSARARDNSELEHFLMREFF